MLCLMPSFSFRDKNTPAKVDQFQFSTEDDFLIIYTQGEVAASNVILLVKYLIIIPNFCLFCVTQINERYNISLCL